MTDFMDTAWTKRAGEWIAPKAKRCDVCAQLIYDKNHPDPCDRPTYDELLKVGQHDDFDPFTPAQRFEHQQRIAHDNMNFAMRYRNLLQTLLDRHNGDSLAPTILSPTDVAEIDAALAWVGD